MDHYFVRIRLCHRWNCSKVQSNGSRAVRSILLSQVSFGRYIFGSSGSKSATAGPGWSIRLNPSQILVSNDDSKSSQIWLNHLKSVIGNWIESSHQDDGNIFLPGGATVALFRRLPDKKYRGHHRRYIGLVKKSARDRAKRGATRWNEIRQSEKGLEIILLQVPYRCPLFAWSDHSVVGFESSFDPPNKVQLCQIWNRVKSELSL